MISINLLSALTIGLFCGWLGLTMVSIYYHRQCAHNALQLRGAALLFARLWAWMISLICARYWVAVHMMHHRYSDTDKDPHNTSSRNLFLFPKQFMEQTSYALRENKRYYRLSYKRVPNDPLERFLTRHKSSGWIWLLFLMVLLFGSYGIVITAIAVVYGLLGHYATIVTAHSTSGARNLKWLSFLLAGEEWHEEHHLNPSSAHCAPYSLRLLDISYVTVLILEFIGLATIKDR